jgi:hypothetical protein
MEYGRIAPWIRTSNANQAKTLQLLLPLRQLEHNSTAATGTVSGRVDDGALLAAVVVTSPETRGAHQARTVSAASSAERTGVSSPGVGSAAGSN